MRISDNMIFLQLYAIKQGQMLLPIETMLSTKMKRRILRNMKLQRGFPDLKNVFLDSGKIGPRENCSAASCLPSATSCNFQN